MRTIEGYELRALGSQNLLVGVGANVAHSGVLRKMNESAAYLWKSVVGKDFTEDMLVDLLLAEYDVSREDATEAVKDLIKDWKAENIIEE
ncbi:MAG: PqqD family protein [Bacteroidaceae bacterium]|nr:PqqD family protein [Bacteroidaceae bacterium]